MEYILVIDQKAAVEAGLVNLVGIEELSILSFMGQFFQSTRTKIIKVKNETYHWLTYNKISTELPLLNSVSKPAMGRRIDKLVTAGLIEKVTKDRNVFYRILEKGLNILPKSIREKLESSSETVEKPVGVTKTEHRCNENVTYHYTLDQKDSNKEIFNFQNPQNLPPFLLHYLSSNELRLHTELNKTDVKEILNHLIKENPKHLDDDIHQSILWGLKGLISNHKKVKDWQYYLYCCAKKRIRNITESNRLVIDLEKFEENEIDELSDMISKRFYTGIGKVPKNRLIQLAEAIY